MSIDSKVEEEFRKHLDNWRRHCEEVSIISALKPYLDCEAYRSLVAMGKKVLHLIRDEYATSDYNDPVHLAWATLIREITEKSPEIPSIEWGNTTQVRHHYLKFLDDYLANRNLS